MKGQDSLHHQRQLLFTFRKATTQRARTESEAATLRTSANETINNFANQAQQNANIKLDEAHKALKQAEIFLTEAKLERLLEKSYYSLSDNLSKIGAEEELTRNVATAAKIPESIQTTIQAWEKWRIKDAARRRFLTRAAIVILVILVIAGFIEYRILRPELLYPSAMKTLKAQEWKVTDHQPNTTIAQPNFPTSTPIPASVSQATHVPFSVPSATATSSFSTMINIDPAQFIHDYYDAINERNYEYTWLLLSPDYKARNNGPDNGGYQGYVDFWNTIASVEVKSAEILVWNEDSAKVVAILQYNLPQGSEQEYEITFFLIPNNHSDNWLINETPFKRIK